MNQLQTVFDRLKEISDKRKEKELPKERKTPMQLKAFRMPKEEASVLEEMAEALGNTPSEIVRESVKATVYHFQGITHQRPK